MDKEYTDKFVPIVANIFRDKIAKMKGIDPEKVNGEALNPMIERAALDYLAIKASMYDYEDVQKMDEFDAQTMNVDGNWYLGELQCKSEDVGIHLDISRFGAEDLSDLSIQLIGQTERGETIAIVESKDGTSASIRDENGRTLRWMDGKMGYKEGQSSLTYDEMPAEDLPTIIEMYRSGRFSRDLQTAKSSNPLLQSVTSETREADMRSQEKQIATLVTDKGKEDSHIDK